MNKKLILTSVLFLAVVVIAVYMLSSDQNTTQNASGIILFYGYGCPHCAIVEEYVDQNDVKAKLSFAKKEVYFNRKNADELAAKAIICGIPTNAIGVPFLWDGSKCFMGDRDIIEFFKSKINEQ